MDDSKKNPAERDDANGPGMTNGIPDDAEQGEATGLPHSDREATETAGKPDA